MLSIKLWIDKISDFHKATTVIISHFMMVTDFDSSVFWGNFSKSNSNILLAKGPVGCSWNELENWVD